MRLTSFVVGAPRGASLKPTGPSRRLHNQAKPSLNARIQASERRLLRERKSLICIGAPRPRTQVLEARKEYKRSVIGSHFPLKDRQARLSDAECGNIDACRQNHRFANSSPLYFTYNSDFFIFFLYSRCNDRFGGHKASSHLLFYW